MSARKQEKPLIISFEAKMTDASCNKLLNSVENNLTHTREKEVHLLIGSGGGNVDPTLRTYHRLRSLPISLTTYAMGSTNSSAIILLLAGSRRYSYRSSSLFFHSISHTFGNGKISLQAGQLRAMADGLEASTKKYVEILANVTQLSKKDAEALMNSSGVTMLPDEALERGIVHKIRELSIPVGSKPVAIRD